MAAPSEAEAVAVASFSTESVAPRQRVDYWHSGVLRRLDSAPRMDDGTSFNARLTRVTRLAGSGGELLDHSGGPQQVRRDVTRCRADGRDDVSLNLMVLSPNTCVAHGAARLTLRAGDMMIIDSTVPTEIKRQKHRVITLFLPRAKVKTVCPDPGRLAGRLMRPDGIAGILRSHLQASIDNVTHMQPQQQVLAMDIAMQLALVALSEEADTLVDAVLLDDGLYHAAQTYIARSCTHLATSPLSVAQYLNCSRSALYRAFSQHGASVSACIWQARLAHGKRLLNADRYRHLQINEIAFRSGFADHSTFDRMFKRTYGMKPKDMRQMGWERS